MSLFGSLFGGGSGTTTITVLSAANVAGDEVSARKGDSWAIPLPALGDISARTGLLLLIKTKSTDADAAAQLGVSEDDGLLYLAGDDADDATLAALIVTDEDVGDILLTVKSTATDALEVCRILVVKAFFANDDETTIADRQFILQKRLVSGPTP
jgi:hypothetical protein